MSKRSYIILDLERSKALDLNPTECILCSCFFGLLAQEPIQYNGKPYYMADYKHVANYCSVIPDKQDTLRRLYKRLENIGIASFIKIDGHICFTPSQMLRDWGTIYIKSDDAEKNPQTTEKNPQTTEKNPIPIINNNINDYKEIDCPQKDFAEETQENKTEETQEDKAKKTLFRNSEIYNLVDFDNTGKPINYTRFEEKFKGVEYDNIDLVYYFHTVADWSDSKNMKRTARGWLATVRQFIRSDIERGKLKKKEIYNNQHKAGALDFLNDFE